MGWSAGWRALALSLPLIVMTAGVPILHQHSGDAPGFYDAECPLAQLLASRSEAGPAQRVELTQPVPMISLAVLPMLPVWVAISALAFDPRGPPSAA